MPSQPYLPKAEAQLVEWLINYRAKLPVHGPACGILPAEITQTLLEIDYLLYAYSWHSTLQADLQEATAHKKNLAFGEGPAAALPAPTVLGTPPPMCAPGVIPRIQKQAARIKVHPGYTQAAGQDMQIVGAADTASHPAPEFSLVPQDGLPNQSVLVKFKKFDHEGVQIEMRRPQYAGAWAVLGNDTRTPYLDSSPLQNSTQPETREYRLRFWDAGEANGDYSAVQSVTVR